MVVHELYVPPVDGLEVVFLLLQLEDVLHKELLEVFIGKVDAELLEGVADEIFETENVENSDGIEATPSCPANKACNAYGFGADAKPPLDCHTVVALKGKDCSAGGIIEPRKCVYG